MNTDLISPPLVAPFSIATPPPRDTQKQGGGLSSRYWDCAINGLDLLKARARLHLKWALGQWFPNRDRNPMWSPLI